MGGVQATCCSGGGGLVKAQGEPKGDEEEPQIATAFGGEEGDLRCSGTATAAATAPREEAVSGGNPVASPRDEVAAADEAGDNAVEAGASTDTTATDTPGSRVADNSAQSSAVEDDALLKEEGVDFDRDVDFDRGISPITQDASEEEEEDKLPQVMERKNSLMHFIRGDMTPTNPKFERKRTRRRSSLVREVGSEANAAAGDYQVGKILGEGTFGIVCACCHCHSEEQLAMKMVDKVETPMVGIIKEAELMYRLSHPNLVRFHDFFDETFFACIVMDKYAGGSLVQGMNRNRKEKDRGLDAKDVHHIFQQLVSPLEYLHNCRVLHRDVNADNYLLDRARISDPECKVALGDLGLACELKPDERIKDQVGRKLFWAPEIANGGSSSFPRDVWALGVTSFGLIDGRFPFANEQEACKYEPNFRFDVHPGCKNFILHMLQRDESRRIRADGLMRHGWITEKELSAVEIQAVIGGAKGPRLQKKPTFKRGRSDDDVSNRRRMLLERILSSSVFNRNKKSDGAEAIRQRLASFSVTDRAGQCTVKCAWWPLDKVEKAGLLSVPAAPVTSLDEKWLHTITLMLRQHGVDTKSKANKKQVKALADEVSRGASRLMLDATAHKRLVRVVSKVELCLRTAHAGGGKPKPLTLVQRRSIDKHDPSAVALPGTVREPHETVQEAALRIARSVLGLPVGCARVTCDAEGGQEEEEDEEQEGSELRSCLGLQTINCKSIVQMEVATEDTRLLSKMGLPKGVAWSATDAAGTVRRFDWLDSKGVAKCQHLKVGTDPADLDAMSRLVPAHVGPTLGDLKAYLQKRSIDISPATHKSLEDLYAETRKGDASLIQSSSGEITHVIDVVVVQLTNARTKAVLVETERVPTAGPRQRTACLPSAKRRADENHFFTAWRVLGEQLMLEMQTIKIDAADVQYFEEEKDSERFPGLKTVLRKRLMKGVLLDEPVSSGQ